MDGVGAALYVGAGPPWETVEPIGSADGAMDVSTDIHTGLLAYVLGWAPIDSVAVAVDGVDVTSGTVASIDW